MATPTKAEYQRRSKYRRYPLADDLWLRLKPLALDFGGKMTRTAFAAAIVRDYIASPHPLRLVDPLKTWSHSQRAKPRKRPSLPPGSPGYLKFVPPEDAKRAAEADWLRRGAPLLGGNEYKKFDLKE